MTRRRIHRLSPVTRAGLALAFGLALVAQIAPASAMAVGEQVVLDVRKEIRNGDCKAAVAALNKGLAERYPEVQMLAASLYEEGACLKTNWKRAENLYLTAWKNGQRMAAYRLAAHAAAPENGPDIPAALWWASRIGLVEACLPAKESRNDPDLFLGEVKTWPEARLANCNYVAGIMATILGEVRYPAEASRFDVAADVRITIRPAAQQVDLTLNGTTQHLRTGLHNGDRLWEQDDRAVGRIFVQGVRTVADRALKRYPKPESMPDDFPEISVTLKFDIGDPAMPNFRW